MRFRTVWSVFASAAIAGVLQAQSAPATPIETLEILTGERNPEREEPDEIETDRDSFTPATEIVGRGLTIVESAYSFIDNRRVQPSHSFPELIIRHGLTDRIELRFGWNADIGGGGNSVTGADAGGSEGDIPGESGIEHEYNAVYGVKLRITDQDRWIPRSIAIIQGYTPTDGDSTASHLVATYAAGWAFPNRWQLDAAMRYGYASDHGDRFNQWAPSVVLRVPFGNKFAGHIEYFSITTTGSERDFTQAYFSPGVRCLVTRNIELGARVGWGLNEDTPKFFANAGFGWRF